MPMVGIFTARVIRPARSAWNRFEHDGKDAGLLQHLGIFRQAVGGFGIPSLRAEASQLVNRLRCQTDMAHDRNTDIDKPFGRIDNLPASFDLDRQRRRLPESIGPALRMASSTLSW